MRNAKVQYWNSHTGTLGAAIPFIVRGGLVIRNIRENAAGDPLTTAQQKTLINRFKGTPHRLHFYHSVNKAAA